MASFKKLPNGTYQATISCGRDANGKQIRKYVTKPTLKECKAAAREIEMEIEENKLLAVSNMRFNSWVDKWLEMKKSHISQSTYVSYKMYVEKHYKPYFGRFKLDQINSLHVREFISKKIEDGLSNTTVRKLFFVLSDIFETALKRKSPMDGLEAPKPIKYEPKVPTQEEFNKIHEALKGTWDEMPLLLAAWCGLRQGEIFALKWNDISWKKGILTVDENRAISENGYIDKSPKSQRGNRKISVPEYLLNLLKNHRKKHLLEILKAKKENKEMPKSPYIFPMRPDSYSGRWSNLITEKKLPDIRFHDLRHYHATILYRAGIPDHYAAHRLGHDIMVLKKLYQHLQLEDKKELDKKVVNLFEKPEN